MNKWIDIKNELPPRYKNVILYSSTKLKRCGKVFEGWYNGKRSIWPFDSWNALDGDHYKMKVTHWQPLPSPPNTTTP